MEQGTLVDVNTLTGQPLFERVAEALGWEYCAPGPDTGGVAGWFSPDEKFYDSIDFYRDINPVIDALHGMGYCVEIMSRCVELTQNGFPAEGIYVEADSWRDAACRALILAKRNAA